MLNSFALPLAFAAGSCTALANLCMRRSIDVGGNTNGYLLVQLLISAFVAIWTNPIQNESYDIDATTMALGVLAGISLAGIMIFMGRSLSRGPAGLSVAFINASTIVPGILLFLIFGSAYGFVFDTQHWAGIALIVIGLFWASTTSLQAKDKWGWVRAISIAFVAHVLLLVLFQYRGLLLKADLPLDPVLLPMHTNEAASFWFVPIMFIVAWLVQARVFWTGGSRALNMKEIGFGLLGGLTNGASAILLVQSTLFARQMESTIIYPLYSVSIVLICSLWSLMLYKERVNWPAIAVAAAGIAIGSM